MLDNQILENLVTESYYRCRQCKHNKFKPVKDLVLQNHFKKVIKNENVKVVECQGCFAILPSIGELK